MKKPIPRIWIFIILFSAIVIAHIIILRVVVRGESGGNTPAEPVPQQTPAAPQSGKVAPAADPAKAAPEQ